MLRKTPLNPGRIFGKNYLYGGHEFRVFYLPGGQTVLTNITCTALPAKVNYLNVCSYKKFLCNSRFD
jgi:hypothetical protein